MHVIYYRVAYDNIATDDNLHVLQLLGLPPQTCTCPAYNPYDSGIFIKIDQFLAELPVSIMHS